MKQSIQNTTIKKLPLIQQTQTLINLRLNRKDLSQAKLASTNQTTS